MNSPFANIFLAIQQHIQDNISAITYIDQDLGQLRPDRGGTITRPAISYPCALIDIEDFHFEDQSENAQTAKGTVVIRLGFAPFSSSSSTTPPDYIESAISYYDIEYDVHQLVQGWNPIDTVGALSRVTVSTQRRFDNLRVREIRYSLAFEDISTAYTANQVSKPLELTPEIDLPA